MRIGRTIIDTDNMTVEDLGTVINELRKIRSRKLEAETFLNAMTDLLTTAHEAGFDFMDKDFGNLIQPKDIQLLDMKNE